LAYDAAADALTDKIARLKELRLARDASRIGRAAAGEENRQEQKAEQADQTEKSSRPVVAGLVEEPPSDRTISRRTIIRRRSWSVARANRAHG
jgi:hypothetical protein